MLGESLQLISLGQRGSVTQVWFWKVFDIRGWLPGGGLVERGRRGSWGQADLAVNACSPGPCATLATLSRAEEYQSRSAGAAHDGACSPHV